MTPESIVTDLEHSKALKEAGWPQGSAWNTFRWFRNKEYNNYFWAFGAGEGCEEIACAPTAEEILRRLPEKINGDPETLLQIQPMDKMKGWSVFYMAGCAGSEEQHADTLANAAAAMYCYLAENKLLPSPHPRSPDERAIKSSYPHS